MKMKKAVRICLLFVLIILISSGCTKKEEPKHEAEYSVSLTAKIKDLSAPVIECRSEISIKVGEKIEWDKLIRVSDNIDESPSYSIEGTVNEKKAGSYSITITAKDSTGNISRKSVTVHVDEKKEKASGSDAGQQQNDTTEEGIKKPQTDSSLPSVPSSPAESRFFAFQENKTSDATYQECMNYVSVQLSGRSGTGSCVVIDDDKGIHIGYQAIFN